MPSKSIFRQPGAKHFQLVHRSQRDPLIHDPDASKHVLKPIERPNAKKGQSRSDLESILPASEIAHDISKNVGEAALYGIYYDDTEYDYMQHLRTVGEKEDGVESILIETPSSSKTRRLQTKKDNETIHDLPEEALASQLETKRTYESQQAIPDSIAGFQPSMDAHLRQALEALEDDAFIDEGLEDNFFGELVADGERESDEEVDFGFDDDYDGKTDPGASDAGSEKADWENQFAQFKQSWKAMQTDSEDEHDSEAGDIVGGLPTMSVTGGKKRRKRTSDASGYSMSSSSMYRNKALQTLDERFEQMIIGYEQDDERAPSSEEDNGSDEAPELLTTREDFESMMDDFLVRYEILGRKMKPKLDGETATDKLDTIRRALGKGDSIRLGDDLTTDEEDDVLMPLDIDDKKDHWDCETILTTYSNLENHPRLIRVRDQKPNPKIHLDPKTGFPTTVDPKKPRVKEEHTPVRKPTSRPRDESKDEKKARKSAVKAERQVRRRDKKNVKEQFVNELRVQKRATGTIKAKKL